MERSKLEKLIKKLETLDVREWKYNDSDGNLTTEVCGMEFRIRILGGVTYLNIKNIENSIRVEEREFFDNKETKYLRGVIEKFYQKTRESLAEYEKKQLTEKLDTFLSD